MNVTESEKNKYERIWRKSVYRENRRSALDAQAFLKACRISAGDSIIDFGCGAGYASSYFTRHGLRVLAIDIAPNCLSDDLPARFDFLESCMWALPADLGADWGFCSDVMEHIPPDKVEIVLSAIALSIKHAVFFSISVRPDGCGKLIGDTLHLTVQPKEWWRDRLRSYWAIVEEIALKEGDHVDYIVREPISNRN